MPRRRIEYALALLLPLALAGALQARELAVMSWNLGWHLDSASFQRWQVACNSSFARDPGDGLWKPDPRGSRTGWQLRWGRDAPIQWDIARLPPCDVYRDGRQIVAPTAAAYAKRRQQIADLIQRQAPDILALQEVSGAAAVREILPDGGRDYQVCSFDGYGVQRLAFAWRRSLGEAAEPCQAYDPLSLPARPADERLRPGLALGLRVEGRLVRLLNLHLKSGCVSPLESDDPNGRGQLAGDNPACLILQEQLQPLENWIEQKSQGTDALILLGDFNRALDQEAGQAGVEAARSAGNPTDPYRPGVRSRNLWREINDGEPATSRLTLIPARCPGSAAALCEAAQSRPLTARETDDLRRPDGLGCRNPVGLDHLAVTGNLAATAEKIPLGKRGRTQAANAHHPDPLLGVSDHCPVLARFNF
ncbi:MAG: endonuclease/exonuclease/phosphatase family protein [Candidatus Competibacter sp.]|nr:endonuclease/exonuclease/phosphatase family protein [Candidatus Competibacter sp.]